MKLATLVAKVLGPMPERRSTRLCPTLAQLPDAPRLVLSDMPDRPAVGDDDVVPVDLAMLRRIRSEVRPDTWPRIPAAPASRG
jgi:hypothetical protein